MAGSDSTVHGSHHGEQKPPVARAELHQLQNSLLEAMERMFNERLPAAGGRGPHQHDRHRGAGHDGGHHRGRHNRDDPDSIARVKLSVPKFTGREDADVYLEWEEQCDQIFRVHNISNQRCVNLASI
ncbi:hypothetical protein PVAP13_4NG161471 [Panicum virgatum]|uniref:Uncharacterized protein n=1 Tax=Panicum virgatum TaxID=38727 RepID=A0A8T0TDB6_PANVG|nr:hypothetical protein PVAP13_4NG161471 [Panicum virgatum]